MGDVPDNEQNKEVTRRSRSNMQLFLTCPFPPELASEEKNMLEILDLVCVSSHFAQTTEALCPLSIRPSG